ncbi:hypothetical protein LTR94_031210, partial [Friedmanniomyces endolithicus]
AVLAARRADRFRRGRRIPARNRERGAGHRAADRQHLSPGRAGGVHGRIRRQGAVRRAAGAAAPRPAADPQAERGRRVPSVRLQPVRHPRDVEGRGQLGGRPQPAPARHLSARAAHPQFRRVRGRRVVAAVQQPGDRRPAEAALRRRPVRAGHRQPGAVPAVRRAGGRIGQFDRAGVSDRQLLLRRQPGPE